MSDSAKSKHRALWMARVDAWQQSGLSSAQFARQQGFSPSTFRNWTRRRARPAPPSFLRLVAKAAAPTPSAPVAPAQAPVTPSLLVEVGAVRLRLAPGFDPTLLRDVVRALGEAAP
jgi:lambda repressor-like predicted transcriptional regulator